MQFLSLSDWPILGQRRLPLDNSITPVVGIGKAAGDDHLSVNGGMNLVHQRRFDLASFTENCWGRSNPMAQLLSPICRYLLT